ncbi:MAG: flagellar protein export ATPase FliI [Gammaproteobacteria bacterium]|nr:MAG: flagellar protein export ATPase FliI [Gammaproteobacteria bacterium]
MIPEGNRKHEWCRRLHAYHDRVEGPIPFIVEGKLYRMVGLTLEAIGCQAAIGAICRVVSPDDEHEIEAEVVGFSGNKLYLMPTGSITGLVPNARVIPTGRVHAAEVGDELLGRVIDGAGRPLDGMGNIHTTDKITFSGRPINPMKRRHISEILDVGIRSINSLYSVGQGQRMGLFAGSGVGKSVLLGMMTRYTEADVIVVGLIGERGREVKEFVDNILGVQGRERAVVVACPADSSPLMRLHGAMLATSVAEYFRDQGKNVLLLMDSLTRFAQAQREIALAIGEPPATRGYPPSVFARIPQLVERAGNGDIGGGSITAFYTVLVEGDDHNDPIADAARAILDGHIVLTRELADAGHYPAVDVEASISRAMTEITDDEHQQIARQFKKHYSTYQRSKDLISVGAYTPGHDKNLDVAVGYNPRMMSFLQQDLNEAVSLEQSLQQLSDMMNVTESPVTMPPPVMQSEPQA